MKFILHRDPDNRSQKIPYPALQISQLADASELTIQADAGSILVSRDDITARQALTTIRHLYEVVDALMEQWWMPPRRSAVIWVASMTRWRMWMMMSWTIS